MLYKFHQLQIQQPTKGYFASSCLEDLKDLNIEISLEGIIKKSKNKFKCIIKAKVKERAFNYLIEKQGSKGKEIDSSNG